MPMLIERAVVIAEKSSTVQCLESRKQLQGVLSQIHTAMAASQARGCQGSDEKVEVLIERAEALLRERGVSLGNDLV